MSYINADLNLSTFSGVIFSISALGLLIAILSFPFLFFSVTRHLDPFFKKSMASIYPMGDNIIIRSGWYAISILVSYWRKDHVNVPRSLHYAIFQDYDLWANATKLQRTIAYVHILSGSIFCLISVIVEGNNFIYHIISTFY